MIRRSRSLLAALTCMATTIALAVVLALGAGTGPVTASTLPPLPTTDLQNLLSLTGFPTPARAPVQDVEPPLKAVPAANCGPGSTPLNGEQGRVDAAAIASPQAATGWTCNLHAVTHFSTPGGFRVWRYTDTAGHTCALYDTSLFSPLNVFSLAAGPSPGVVVLDMADPAHPVQTDTLTAPAMLAPHESLNLNARRGLLAAELGSGGSYPGLMAIYSLSADCRHPVLEANYQAARFGHESGFAPDGRTFYLGGGEGIAAVDVSDPAHPRTLWDGNVFAHGLNVSADGRTLYDADPIDGDLISLDVSQIQARAADPVVKEISRLTWQTVSVPQNTIPMTIHQHRYLLEFDEFAFRFNPYTYDDLAGGARIIDVADPRHPRVVSNLRLVVNMRAAHKAADNDPSPLHGSGFTYAAHYCGIPRATDPGIAACSFINSGLRVFDISDPLHPREAAYYVSPPKQATNGNHGDFAMSQPAFDPARRQIWYTDASSGFWALTLDARAWPNPLGRTLAARRARCARGNSRRGAARCTRHRHVRARRRMRAARSGT